MKQLQPKTILAIGLPCSLLFNLFVGVSIFYVFGSSLDNGLDIGITLGAIAWVFGSVPVFVAMALIRSRIGKFDVKKHQIKEAMICWRQSFVATLMVVVGASLQLSLFFVDSVFLGIGYGWIIGFGVTLVLIIGLNVVIRSFSKEQVV